MTTATETFVPYLVNVPVEDVIPNPVNPRKNDAVRTEDIQKILADGWKIPVTAYKQGNVYVLLAGHRRRHAAKLMGVAEIPVFVVAKPKDDNEEQLTIATLQRGSQEDWNMWEWAEFTYRRWEYLGKPSTNKFAELTGLARGTSNEYITVLDFYKWEDIETKILTEQYSISTLYATVVWMKKFARLRPELYQGLTPELILRCLFEKMDRKLYSRADMQKDQFIVQSTDAQMKTFLTTYTMDFNQAKDMVGMVEDEKGKKFHGALVSLGMYTSRVQEIFPKRAGQYEKLLDSLKVLQNTVEDHIARIHEQAVEKGWVVGNDDVLSNEVDRSTDSDLESIPNVDLETGEILEDMPKNKMTKKYFKAE